MKGFLRFGKAATIAVFACVTGVACSSGAPTSSTEDAPRLGHTSQAALGDTDFEADTLGGSPDPVWTRQTKLYFGYTSADPNAPPTSLSALDLRASPNGAFTAVDGIKVRSGMTASQRDEDLITKFPTPSQDFFRFPKYGTKSAVVNYDYANATHATGSPLDNHTGENHNANILSQPMVLGTTDIDPADGQFHVRFVYAPIVTSGGHPLNKQPFVGVRLRRCTDATCAAFSSVLYENFVAASTAGAPWLATGSGAYDPYYFGPMAPADHVAGWKIVDIIPGSANVTLGDSVYLEIIGSGCAQTGHWGRVYVDNFQVGIPDLFVIAHGATAANDNTNVTYTYTYKNGGTATATNASVDFAVPQGMTFVSTTLAGCTTHTFADPRAAANLPPVTVPTSYPDVELHTCPVGDVAAGVSGNFQAVMHVNAGTVGALDTNGHYSSYAGNVDPLVGPDIRTTITNGVAYTDIATAITTPGVAAVAANGAISYTATVSNNGAMDKTNVGITTSSTNASLGNWTCVAAGANTTCPANGTGAISATNVAIGAGGSLTFTMAGTAGPGGTPATAVAFTKIVATVGAGNAEDFDTTNNAAGSSLPIGTLRDVVVTKGNLGTIQSAPAGINCGVNCKTATGKFIDGGTVVLQATPPAGGQFVGWTGDCAPPVGVGNTCTIVANANKNVGAKFAGPASMLIANGGAVQSTTVSTVFPQPLAVKLVDSEGTGIPNATVSFAAPGSGASAVLNPLTNVVTDTNGTGQVAATANATAGTYNVTATFGALNARFTLTNTPPPGSIIVVSGSPQSKVVGGVFDAPLVIEVRDYQNQLEPNALVRFSGPSAGATAIFATPVVTTGADGRATVTATANTVAGTYNVGVNVDNTAAPAVFALTNTPGPAASIQAVGGSDRQATKIGTAFGKPLSVEVRDAYDNLITGARVNYAAPNGDPTAALSASFATTDVAGRTSVTATASNAIGTYLVSAIVAGSSLKADFSLENLQDSPFVVRAETGTPQTTAVNTPFGAPLVVVVTKDDQPQKDVAITFSPPAAGATAKLSSTTVNTDASGHARVTATASTKAGIFDVVVTTTHAASPATFALRSVPGAPARVVVDALSSPQNAKVLTAFATPARAAVVDSFGNPIQGVTVKYDAPTDGASASLSSPTAVTDAAGNAEVTAIANGTAGTYDVNASVEGVIAPGAFHFGNLLTDPVLLFATGGTPQSSAVGASFAAALVGTVKDRVGSTVSGNDVSFSAGAQDGASATLGGPVSTTGADGQASMTAKANTVAGTYGVYASATNGASPVRFLLTNTQAKLAALTVADISSPQSAALGAAYPQKLRVVALDANKNPLKGVIITLTPPTSGPSTLLSEVAPATDANGAIEVIGVASSGVGTFTLPASAQGAPSVNLTLTNTNNDDGTLEGGGINCGLSRSSSTRGVAVWGLLFAAAALVRRRRP